jgi:hypothetical protein
MQQMEFAHMTKTLTALALILTASVVTAANATMFEGCTNAVPVMSELNPGTVLYWNADCGYPAEASPSPSIFEWEAVLDRDLNGDGTIGQPDA